jgi:transcriptional regulator with XRE-family HTH domain
LTVANLAAAADISSERLKTFERGELDPDYDLLVTLAACLDTRPSTFIVRAEDLSRRSR